ncbi:MAG: type II secretion system protein GspE [Desulfobacteraceae bacterium]|nr:MAG: type II secretion system protein GspE [Desulfobacteraceae bacterium]
MAIVHAIKEKLNLLRSSTPTVVERSASGESLSEEERLAELSKALGIPYSRHILSQLESNGSLEAPIQYFKRMGFVPLKRENSLLTVALNDPLNFQAVDDFARMGGYQKVQMILSPLKEIHSAIHILFDQNGEDAEKMVQDLEGSELDTRVTELEELEDLLDTTHEAPIIRLVNVILTQAIRRKTSDIHIEPYEKEIKVRFRIDGVLYEIFSLPKRFHAHIVSRLKVMANLDIAEKRLPQDGRMKIKAADRTVDVRVSIIPMAFGERIVLRLLDKGVSLMGLEEMGLTRKGLATFERLLTRSNGILLVTGPTGSGKSTTLYATLNKINSSEKNIITIEDPIEYQLKGVGQIQVNTKTDLTFARGLRSILRHDPDIVMVGEIRDLETVEIAVQASLTGHLVFSTLHTNDAAGALTRLVDMGVEPFLIASSLQAVVAQRLVRTICPDCREPLSTNEAMAVEIGTPATGQTLYRGAGCSSCMGSGFRGRTGIFEILEMDNQIRRLVTSGADAVTIKEAAVNAGMSTLFEDGLLKVKAGITTFDEVVRVTQK